MTFLGEAAGAVIRCAISREALEDHLASGLRTFRDHRAAIERMAQIKYLTWPVEEAGSVLIKTEDVARLRDFKHKA